MVDTAFKQQGRFKICKGGIMKKVYVLLAEGFELLEAAAPIDVMRRAGIKVVTLSLNKTLEVNSAQDVMVKADDMFGDYKDADGIFLPGGYSGYENLFKSDEAMVLTKYYLDNNKLVAAICGAPSSIGRRRMIDGRNITLHFSTHELVKDFCNIVDTPIVKDGNLITASGSGYSQALGFAILEYLAPETIEKVKKGMTL